MQRVSLSSLRSNAARRPFRRLGVSVAVVGSLGLTACNTAAPAPTQTCGVPAGTSMATLIKRVFTCELQRQGVPSSAISRAVGEADRVAWCESRHRPNVTVFDGKYVNTPNPATGYRYSAAGLFQIIRSTADAYVPGGYAKVYDPVANTRGAARIWEWGYSRGRDPWQPWTCKPGSDVERRAAAER